MISRNQALGGVFVVALLVAGALSHLASSAPDGLERVAADLDFEQRARPAAFQVLPDYGVPGLGDTRLSGTLAGLTGTVVVFGLALGLGALLRRR